MRKSGLAGAFLAAACLLLGASVLMAAPNPPAEVLQAAESGLPEFLVKIPLPEMEGYGFAGTDDLGAATLGAPYLLHQITPAALATYKAGEPVASMLSPTTLWYFPVLVAGQIKAVLVVDRLDGQWQAVSLGYAGLARELGLMGQRWKTMPDCNPVLVVVYQARQYLFTVPEKDAVNLTPLTVAQAQSGKAAGADYAVLGNAADVITGLQAVVRDTLNESKLK